MVGTIKYVPTYIYGYIIYIWEIIYNIMIDRITIISRSLRGELLVYLKMYKKYISMGDPTISNIYKYIIDDLDYNITDIEPKLRLYESKFGEDIINKLNQGFKDSLSYSIKDIENIYVELRDWIYNGYINLNCIGTLSTMAIIDKMREDSFSLPKTLATSSDGSYVSYSSLRHLDMKLFKDSTAFHSFSKTIDDCTNGGYGTNTVICVAAPPMTGKSFFLINELISAYYQGRKCYYLALADLSLGDFKDRLLSIITNVSLTYIKNNRDTFYKQFDDSKSGEILDNIYFDSVAAGQYTIHDWYDINNNKGILEKYNTFFIDYDSNFKTTSDSLYDKGSEIYNLLDMVSMQKDNIVIVASQVEKSVWQDPKIRMSSLGESRRKAEIVDMMIGLSLVDANCGENHIGLINIGKNRRGPVGSKNYILSGSGRFHELDPMEFAGIQQSKSKVEDYPISEYYKKLDKLQNTDNNDNLKKEKSNKENKAEENDIPS